MRLKLDAAGYAWVANDPSAAEVSISPRSVSVQQAVVYYLSAFAYDGVVSRLEDSHRFMAFDLVKEKGGEV